jgi:hypothetical protein
MPQPRSAATLLLDGADAEALMRQLELALMLDGHLRFLS